MNYPRFLFLFLLLIFFLPNAFSQFYSGGNSPGSVRWSQINTDNFQIIFPEEYSEQGKYIANILEYAYLHATASLQHQPRKVSVIVHNQTSVSNGFVSWAPRRIELFTNPPADNQPHDWMEYLALHEFRHVVQLDKLHQGITRVLGFIVGEQAVGAVLGLFVPLWFIEGDAVVMETALTHAGRGRAPSFEQGLRAQVLSRGIYSYDKAYFGSYKDFVPNYYQLGYQMVATGRIHKSADVWAGVVDNTARRPIPGTFSAGMRKNLDEGIDRYYRNTFRFLDSAWTHQHQQYQYTSSTSITQPQRLYTSYTQPFWINDSTVIALKTGLGDIPRIVKVDLEGNEEILITPGWYFPNAFDFAARKLVWNEQRPDPRWEHRNWSEIMVYDIQSNIRRRLTHKGRFFSPAISHDGKRIAAVETSRLSEYTLVIMDSENAEVFMRYAYPDNHFMQDLAWHPNGNLIAVSVLDHAGKRIDLIDIHTQEVQTLLPSMYFDFSSLRAYEDYLVFNGTWSGIDNIYAIDWHTGDVEQVVSSEYGAINASVNPSGTHLVYADYTASGYMLSMVPVNQLQAVPLSDIQDFSPSLHYILASQENAIISQPNIPLNDHEIRRYSRLANLFHLHSWAPAYIDGSNQEAYPGASLLFQNKLSTSYATLGYLWDTNEEVGKFTFNYSYHGWYPVISLLAESGQRRLSYRAENTIENFLVGESVYRIGISVPLRFQKNEYLLGLSPSVSIGLNHAFPNRNTPDTIFINQDTFIAFTENRVYRQDFRLMGYRMVRRVARDIYPRWGQIVDLNYRHTPFSEINMGSIAAARGMFYFPGLFHHQGLRLSASWQQRNPGIRLPNTLNYSFSNLILYPRGISGQVHENVVSFSADYVFPIGYPDLSIRPLIYMMRLRGHVFADVARGKLFPVPNQPNLELNQQFFSQGVGLISDMHLFRLFPPLTIGFEVAFPRDHDIFYRFVFSVGI